MCPKYGQIYDHMEGLWNENISCHINKQEMSQPSVISGHQMWMRALKTDPADAATFHGDCSSHLPLLKVNKETGLLQVAEVLMKGTSPASPETCIFPNREC